MHGDVVDAVDAVVDDAVVDDAVVDAVGAIDDTEIGVMLCVVFIAALLFYPHNKKSRSHKRSMAEDAIMRFCDASARIEGLKKGADESRALRKANNALRASVGDALATASCATVFCEGQQFYAYTKTTHASAPPTPERIAAAIMKATPEDLDRERMACAGGVCTLADAIEAWVRRSLKESGSQRSRVVIGTKPPAEGTAVVTTTTPSQDVVDTVQHYSANATRLKALHKAAKEARAPLRAQVDTAKPVVDSYLQTGTSASQNVTLTDANGASASFILRRSVQRRKARVSMRAMLPRLRKVVCDVCGATADPTPPALRRLQQCQLRETLEEAAGNEEEETSAKIAVTRVR
jgi:hypothetical protein